MRPGRVVMLVIGCLLLLPGVAMLAGGGGLALAYATQRDDDGYFDVTIDRVASPTAVVTTDDLLFSADPGSPDWLLDVIDADVRLRVRGADSSREIFVGIAREADVAAYVDGVEHDAVVELDGRTPIYERRPGDVMVSPPADQTFWVVSEVGAGTQELLWSAEAGRWAVVVMNADSSAGVLVDVNAGVKSGVVLPLAVMLLVLGVATLAAAIALIVAGSKRTDAQEAVVAEGDDGSVLGPVVPHAVVVEARLDPELSRWMWLVKWVLAIPHVVVLVLLWIAFVVSTFVAGLSILITGRYPRGIFDFNVGVMRWSWRVSYYATTGGIGTDRYPPFTLRPMHDDLAHLDVEYPERLHRGFVLVKWLLAIPHLVIVALLSGSSVRWLTATGDGLAFDLSAGGGLLGVLVIVAGFALLFTGRYPRSLFDLIVGLNRWIFRVVAYVALMTDTYPPFRLDQGGTEPHGSDPPMPLPPPTSATERGREPVGDGR